MFVLIFNMLVELFHPCRGKTHYVGARAREMPRTSAYFIKDPPVRANPIDDLTQRLSQAFRDSPLQDMERNLKVILGGFFERFDLVLREDFDIQKELLAKAASRVAELEARVAALEARAGKEP